MSPIVRNTIVICALIGLASALASTYMHYQLVHDPTYSSFCDIDENVSCTQVYLSRFGSIGGIPVALLGAFWFGLVLLLSVAAGGGSGALAETIGGYMLVLSTVGLAAVLFLGFESFFVLGLVCLLCAIGYAAVLGIFVSSSAIQTVSLWSLPRRAVGDFGRLLKTPVALGIASGYMALGVTAVMLFVAVPASFNSEAGLSPGSDPSVRPVSGESEFERFWNAEPRVELPVDKHGAQVLVIKFNDYQCPSCAQSYFLYEPIFARYESSHPGAVRHVRLDYPLDPECNDQTPRGGHQGACEAAVAVRLARREGRDEEMARWLYENQQTMSLETVRQGLVDVAGVTDFDELYETTLNDVRSDIALGAMIDIEATPTFVINGVVIKGGLQPQLFEEAIALELERLALESALP
ncbi:MAG: hypothetical protein CL484_16395 [Acidobacteria bacterium]|nr:hypothetical protein [Acidobacteriota bacterium]|tara:strand:- start:21319 stop:22545 length:1227 start_codon:yes stop_codon:yes gene_type:complete